MLDFKQSAAQDSGDIDSFSERLIYLKNLDFGRFVEKSTSPIMKGGYDWDLEIACYAENLYKKWLYLLMKYGIDSIEIVALQDLFWHLHILDTNNYRKDCEVLFGRYLHHDPFPEKGNGDYLIKKEVWVHPFNDNSEKQ